MEGSKIILVIDSLLISKHLNKLFASYTSQEYLFEEVNSINLSVLMQEARKIKKVKEI